MLDEKPGEVGDGLLRQLSRFRLRDADESPDEGRTLSLRLDAVSTGALSKTDISVMELGLGAIVRADESKVSK